MFQRAYFKLIKSRISEKRKFIQVVFGPRQVGKTTTIMQVLKESKVPFHSISADGVAATDQSWITQQWDIARLKMNTEEAKECILVIDEIQKIDNWSEAAKMNWDQDTKDEINVKVVLLGSSRLHLQQGLTESLAGRFESIYMGHWSFAEMQEAFGYDAKQYIWFGGYPGPAEFIHDEQRWKSYVSNALIETSISKDILMLTRVDKPALMKKLFELGCLYSGQILSFTKIMGQLQDAGNTTTLAHYLHLTDTAGLLGGLEKYAGAAIRQRSSSPKFQVHNTALISAQRPETMQEVYSRPDAWGRIVESAVGAHLLNNSIIHGYTVSYWRNGNDEVDFVLELKGKVIGLEVKSGLTGRISGMKAFEKQMKPDKMLLIGKTGIPVEEFLKMDVGAVL
jgi:predicted AAA+ superfamily ATPase